MADPLPSRGDLRHSMSRTHPYKPAPGSTESRVVELLRFLPAGTALHGRELDARLGLGERRGLHTLLKPSVDHGLLKVEKREIDGRLRTYWMDPRPFPSFSEERDDQH